MLLRTLLAMRFASYVYTVTVDNNGNETLANTPLTYVVGGVTRSVLETQSHVMQ